MSPLNLPKMENRLPTGVGSRGGTFDQDRPAYYRRWRKNNPEYRKREHARVTLARQRRRDEQNMPSFADAIRTILVREVAKTGYRQVGQKTMVEHSLIHRALNQHQRMGEDTINAVVATYGFDEVIRTMRELRRNARSE